MADLCRSCGNPIYDYDTRIHAIQGYEESRKGGGTNHVLNKQRLDGWIWHKGCWQDLMRRRRGHGEQLQIGGAE
jgi:hypothetical protein